jgi:hypothetical protein
LIQALSIDKDSPPHSNSAREVFWLVKMVACRGFSKCSNDGSQ